MKIKKYISLAAGLLISWSTYAQQDPTISAVTITPATVSANQPITISMNVGNEGSEAITGANELEKIGFTLSLSSSISNVSIDAQSTALLYFDITYDQANNVVEGIQKNNTPIAGNTSYEVIVNATSTSNFVHALGNVIPNVMAVINEQLTFNDAKAHETSLPVQLVSFTAQRENATVALQWQTTEEVNSDHFEILHSINGQNWNTLATVNAQRNSSTLQTYTYVDQYPESGVNYYRLKMVDLDGSYVMSSLQSTVFDEAIGIVFSPNPVANLLTIKGISTEKVARVEIHTIAGQRVAQASSLAPLNVQQLPAGLYIVTINRKDGSKSSHKIIKN
jgi:hypothetical protein